MAFTACLQPDAPSDRPLDETPPRRHWLATLLTHGRTATSPVRCTCFEGEPDGAAFRQTVPEAGLIQALRLSARQLTRQADALADGASNQAGPVAVQAMLAGVLAVVRPVAVQAGLAVLRDGDPHLDAVCCADPVQLHDLLVHLVLRTLATERSPGHVRILVALTSGEAQLRILGRGAAGAADAAADRQALAAAERVLHAGGSLILEPRRAGYLPLCVVLRALSSSAVRRPL